MVPTLSSHAHAEICRGAEGRDCEQRGRGAEATNPLHSLAPLLPCSLAPLPLCSLAPLLAFTLLCSQFQSRVPPRRHAPHYVCDPGKRLALENAGRDGGSI